MNLNGIPGQTVSEVVTIEPVQMDELKILGMTLKYNKQIKAELIKPAQGEKTWKVRVSCYSEHPADIYDFITLTTDNSGFDVHKADETKAVLSNEGLQVSSIKHHNYFLWKDGIISFENENIVAIMRKLELYYDIKILIKNPGISTKRFSGKFRTKDGVEHVLRVLQLRMDFIYEKDEQENIITIK